MEMNRHSDLPFSTMFQCSFQSMFYFHASFVPGQWLQFLGLDPMHKIIRKNPHTHTQIKWIFFSAKLVNEIEIDIIVIFSGLQIIDYMPKQNFLHGDSPIAAQGNRGNSQSMYECVSACNHTIRTPYTDPFASSQCYWPIINSDMYKIRIRSKANPSLQLKARRCCTQSQMRCTHIRRTKRTAANAFAHVPFPYNQASLTTN